jgi:hypothetical protein
MASTMRRPFGRGCGACGSRAGALCVGKPGGQVDCRRCIERKHVVSSRNQTLGRPPSARRGSADPAGSCPQTARDAPELKSSIEARRDAVTRRAAFQPVDPIRSADRILLDKVVTESTSFDNMAPGEGAFTEEITTWSAPPLMGDFWDDTVAIDSSRPLQKTGFHIRADELPLPG